MLDYVNEIILRQDARDPVSKIESFVNETASRRVLKDLIEEFKLECKKIADKSKIHDDQLIKLKYWQDNNDPIIKELQQVANTVRAFEKRIATSESKIDSLRESVDKRMEGLKDYVNRTREVLESRVD